MQSIITDVRHNILAEPIKRVALERSNNEASEQAPFSIYRDILFLAFTVLGRSNIDQSELKIQNCVTKMKSNFQMQSTIPQVSLIEST